VFIRRKEEGIKGSGEISVIRIYLRKAGSQTPRVREWRGINFLPGVHI